MRRVSSCSVLHECQRYITLFPYKQSFFSFLYWTVHTKDFLIELLRLFYDIPVAGVMCNGRMDLRKLSKDVVWLQQWEQLTKPMYIHHYSLFTFIHTFPALNINWYRISENCGRQEYAVAELMSKDFIQMPIANSLHIRSRIMN